MASLDLSNTNLSLLAIPAYHLLALFPHALALRLVIGTQPSRYDNRNPRSASYKQSNEKRFSPAKFAKWERLEACHANAFEQMPLFYSAVVAGNLAGLGKIEGSGGLNWLVGAFFAIRIAYTGVYAYNDNQAKSAVRSLLYFAGVGVCYAILYKAAKVLV